MTTLKTYCESGTFARGKDALSGTASIAMFGNTNQPVEVMVRSSHLFMPMPDVIHEDMAFLDRVHLYIPSWEVPKMRVEFFTDHYGFVVDYLAEAMRELRKHNYTETIDRHFSLGFHLNARDVKAVRKSVSGLVKLVYPHGELSNEELAELVELALWEGRRRVKEQLKKMRSFEYHQTSFSLIDNKTREEKFVGVPEQGGGALMLSSTSTSGAFYGPGTGMLDRSMIDQLRRRRVPLIGEANGWWSFLHIDDAAAATAIAIERGAAGIYNIVDDEPAPVREWLPALAALVGAKPPLRVPKWLARLIAGEHIVTMMTETRAGSNAKAKRDLAWRPVHASWRQGFAEVLARAV